LTGRSVQIRGWTDRPVKPDDDDVVKPDDDDVIATGQV